MSQALHTSSTGINAGQSQINVIAHNVANINTTAFKAANMVFEDLYSHNLSYGSAATKDGGGTNPKQIGVGVKVGGITRNFANGTFVSTGRDLDCMISGTGFFVVQDADGASYFTRDGVFSLDSAGNIVTQSGMKVAGAKTTYTNAGSNKTLKVPKNMLAKVSGDPNLGTKTLSSLNNASITGGNVVFTVDGTQYTATIAQADPNKTVGDLTVNQVLGMLNATGAGEIFSIENGAIKYDDTKVVKFVSEGTTSNFAAESGLALENPGYELNQVASLTDVVNFNDAGVISINNVSIDENGILIATYSDGSVLTQYVDDADTLQWKYTTSEGVIITGSDVTATGSSITNSNFTIELATMVNEEGLISVGNNLWKWGPNVGDIYYGMAGEMAFGPIESGGYEGSNVDIAAELTNMISAQRMIQMNSRVFSAASEVMQTLAYLGS